jgi:hypothetical protein
LKLAALATAWLTQDRQLRVRQREELRRTLTEVAEARNWVAARADPEASPLQDVEDLTRAGMRLVQQELVEELTEKKNEVSELREVADSLRRLAGAGDWGGPVEVSYSHTVRQPDGLVTKKRTLTLVDTAEAEEAAAGIEKRLDAWENLRSRMQEDLERRQRQLREIADNVSAFAVASGTLVSDVLAILSQTG